ncbi:MAG: 50S ribosomal protein L18 [Candidatus Delongbacteria bacterium]|nr:50S ribosomal protein L18 [Candidatus Delongbacteria bacterium]
MFTKLRSKNDFRKKRHIRIMKRIQGTPERPRLMVYRSLKYIYAQLMDDVNHKCLTGLGSHLKDISSQKANKVEKSKLVGKMLAEKAKSLGIEKVVFDRNGYLYHGRVKALAEGAREGGLIF